MKNNGLESLMGKSKVLQKYSAALTSEDQTQNALVLENLQFLLTMILQIIVKTIALHLQVEEKTLSLQQVL